MVFRCPFYYDLSVTNDWLYFDEKGENLLETETVEFVCNGESLVKDVEVIEVAPYTGPNNKPIQYKGFDGEKVFWTFVVIVLK